MSETGEHMEADVVSFEDERRLRTRRKIEKKWDAYFVGPLNGLDLGLPKDQLVGLLVKIALSGRAREQRLQRVSDFVIAFQRSTKNMSRISGAQFTQDAANKLEKDMLAFANTENVVRAVNRYNRSGNIVQFTMADRGRAGHDSDGEDMA